MENIQFEYETTSLVWDREVPVSVDSYDNEEETKKLVAEKLHWLNENKAKILEAFMEENDHYVEAINEMIEKGEFKSEAITSEDLKNALYVYYVSITVMGEDTGFWLDLNAEPDYLLGHLACMEVDKEYCVEFGGMNG